MTVKELIKELQELPAALHSKQVFTYEKDGEMSNPKVSTILKNGYNPLDKTPQKVLGIFIG